MIDNSSFPNEELKVLLLMCDMS